MDFKFEKAKSSLKELSNTFVQNNDVSQNEKPNLSDFRLHQHPPGWIPLAGMMPIINYCSDTDLKNLIKVSKQWNCILPNRMREAMTRNPTARDNISITRLPFSNQIEIETLSSRRLYSTSFDRLLHCIWYLNPEKLQIKCCYEDVRLNSWLPSKWMQQIPEILVECINKRYETRTDPNFVEVFKTNLLEAVQPIRNITSLKLTADHIILKNTSNSFTIRWRNPKIPFTKDDILRLLNIINIDEELYLNLFLDNFDFVGLEEALKDSVNL